jgi:hypothetical protein
MAIFIWNARFRAGTYRKTSEVKVDNHQQASLNSRDHPFKHLADVVDNTITAPPNNDFFAASTRILFDPDQDKSRIRNTEW